MSNIFGNLAAGAGAFFGLPEFGISERLNGQPSPGAQEYLNKTTPSPQNFQNGGQLQAGKSILDYNKYAFPTTSSGGTPTYTNATTGGTPSGQTAGGGITPDGSYSAGYHGGPSAEELANQTRGAINSGYDAYFGQLDDILNNGLPQQRTAQEGIANSQYQQGVDTLGSQKTLGLHDLQGTRDKATTQQSKTLTDLGDNIRNLFQAGNVYLGAKGAADSSAANQYSYALTKLGSKQRGDVTGQYAGIQNDINDREFKLNETYNSEVNNLKSTLDQQIQSIGSWFAEQQNALKQAKAQGQLSRGQDLANLSQNLLNVALQQVQNVQAQAQAQHSALQEWALNHSNSIAQVKQNLAGLSQTNYNMPTASPVSGQPAFSGGGGNPSLFGYGTSETPKRDIFGNTIA